MKTAIILHGKPDEAEYRAPNGVLMSKKHWVPWIQRQLILNGVFAQAPEFYEPYSPNYEKWKELFERFDINEDTMLVGHSCGGGFLVRWLSENNVKVGKVVLVAPWTDPQDEMKSDFFKFTIDENIAAKTQSLMVIYSDDDYPDIQETIEILKKKLKGADFKEFSGKGHFCLGDKMESEAFPELLEVLLK